jgi:protein-S-isoprenylcysteine O-methyltransferase Ste14
MMSDRARGRLLVVAQFALLALIAGAPGGRLWPNAAWLVWLELGFLAAGVTILIKAFAHLGPALTANPVPIDGAPLQIRGLYSHVRHPIYTGVLVTALGVAVYRAAAISILAFVILVVLLNFKARWEEVFLKRKHSEYLAYMEQVPRFLPRAKPKPDAH